MLAFLVFSICAFIITVTDANHFLGGTITWRPVNVSATGTPVAIIIIQTTSWNYSLIQCTNAAISSGSPIPNVSTLGPVRLRCINNCGAGSVGYPSNISVIPVCTGFSAPVGTTVGQRSDIVYLQSGDDFTVAFALGAWRSLATVVGANWSLAVRIDVNPRPDNGLYNSAPVATVMSPISIPYNKTITLNIPVADADGDTLRCRWSTNSNGTNECGGVCPPNSLPPNTVIYSNCTIIITGLNTSDWYAVAIMVEDFIDPSSTAPLSSVPVQFLIQVVNPAACITPPAIIGVPDEQSCTPVIVGQTTVIELIAINSCGPNVTILDISTLAFAGITQGNITKRNATTYHKVYTWISTTAQLGYQVMCAMAYDSQYAQSAQYCFQFYASQSVISSCPGDTSTTTTTTETTTKTTTTETTTKTTTTETTTKTTTTETTTETATATTGITISSTNATTAGAPSTNTTTTVAPSTNTTITAAPSTNATTAGVPSTNATTITVATLTSITLNTSIMSTATSTVLAASSTSPKSDITTSTQRKSDPIIWPIVGIITGVLLCAIALCCCCCWYYLCPVAARSYVYNSNATPILYHIERCRDPDCDGSNRSALSDISSSVFKGHSVGSDIDDTPVIDYIKRSKLSSIAKIKTETKSDRSSIPISRFSLLSEDSSSTNKVARESVARVKVDHTVGTTGNPGIKPPVREIHKGRKVTPLDLRNTRVSHIPWSEKPKSSCAQKKLLTKFSRSSGNRNSDQSNDNIQVTRIRSVSLNTISRSTAAGDTSLSTFDDAIHLNDYDITKQNSFLVHKADSQLKHSFSESTSTQTNSSSQSDPTGVLSITSKLKFSISVRSHTRVEHLPRTIIQTDSRNSAPLFSGAQEKQRLNRVFVTRVPRKSLT